MSLSNYSARVTRSWRHVGSIRESLQVPSLVFAVSVGLTLLALLLDGTLFRIWALNRDQGQIEARIAELKESIRHQEAKLIESNNLDFIERQAREHFDFVRDGDLVFVFADSNDEPDLNEPNATHRKKSEGRR